MTEFEVKSEPVVRCRTCLGEGRDLKPLGELTTVFKKLFHELEELFHVDTMEICWECALALAKIDEFYNLVQKAAKELKNEEKNIIKTEPKTTEPVETEQSITDENLIKEESSDSSVDITEPLTETAEDIEEKPQIKQENKKRDLDKKPKYIVLNDKQKVIFEKITLNSDELITYLSDRKTSKYYNDKESKCESCVIGFSNEQLLNKHNKKYHKKSHQYICNICQSRFALNSSLIVHNSAHYNAYKCKICGFICQDFSLRMKHEVEHNRVLKCLMCDAKFMATTSQRQQRLDFYVHYKQLHLTYKCDYCRKIFGRRSLIEKHIRINHTPKQCKLCGKVLKRLRVYKSHMELAHPVPTDRPIYCVECDEHFENQLIFQRHLTTVRHKPRPKQKIPCTACDKVFTKKTYMKHHYELVHLNKINNSCDVCGKHYTRKSGLSRHKREVHEGIPKPRNKICKICGRGFSQNRILENHIRTHTGERPFSCEICSAAFGQKTALLSHIKTQHNNKTKL